MLNHLGSINYNNKHIARVNATISMRGLMVAVQVRGGVVTGEGLWMRDDLNNIVH
jgi:hypothetical protein